MLKMFAIMVCATGSLALSACGTPKGDAALTGGAVGAGGGALLGAVAGFNPLVGAAVGGAAGATVGAATH